MSELIDKQASRVELISAQEPNAESVLSPQLHRGSSRLLRLPVTNPSLSPWDSSVHRNFDFQI